MSYTKTILFVAVVLAGGIALSAKSHPSFPKSAQRALVQSNMERANESEISGPTVAVQDFMGKMFTTVDFISWTRDEPETVKALVRNMNHHNCTVVLQKKKDSGYERFQWQLQEVKCTKQSSTDVKQTYANTPMKETSRTQEDDPDPKIAAQELIGRMFTTVEILPSPIKEPDKAKARVRNINDQDCTVELHKTIDPGYARFQWEVQELQCVKIQQPKNKKKTSPRLPNNL